MVTFEKNTQLDSTTLLPKDYCKKEMSGRKRTELDSFHDN